MTKYSKKIWDEVQAGWEAGQSFYQLGAVKKFPSKQAINTRANSEKWERDLDGIIAAKVAARVAGIDGGNTNRVKIDTALDGEADIRATVELRHRRNLSDAADLLDTAISNSLALPDRTEKKIGSKAWVLEEIAREKLIKARMDAVGAALGAISTLQALERVAYRLDLDGQRDNGNEINIIQTIVDPKKEACVE